MLYSRQLCQKLSYGVAVVYSLASLVTRWAVICKFASILNVVYTLKHSWSNSLNCSVFIPMSDSENPLFQMWPEKM